MRRNRRARAGAFTLVEVLIATSIFTIIMALVMASVVGMFNSLRVARKAIETQQKERFFLFKFGKEISSITRIIYPQTRFTGDASKFFFVFAREDSLVESGYACDTASGSLTHFSQVPADYDWSTYQVKETSLDNLSSCVFSYSDGVDWLASWDDAKKFPKAIKIDFKFKDDDRNREFIVNIPLSQ